MKMPTKADRERIEKAVKEIASKMDPKEMAQTQMVARVMMKEMAERMWPGVTHQVTEYLEAEGSRATPDRITEMATELFDGLMECKPDFIPDEFCPPVEVVGVLMQVFLEETLATKN